MGTKSQISRPNDQQGHGSMIAVDAYCGAGGLSLGFQTIGFEVVYAFDNDPVSINTYNRNLGHHAFVDDAYKVSKSKIEETIGRELPEVDIVMGGPPCQGFSVQRRGSDTDKRNDLVLEYIRLVLELKPKFFLMENVGGLLSVRGKPILEELKKRCDQAGYAIYIQKLNAYEYGVPQMRKRVFIVGEHMNTPFFRFSFPTPDPEILANSRRTVRQAIEDLMDKTDQDVPNHVSDRLSPINLERIRALKAGQGREDLPEHLQLPCHTKNNGHRHLDVYGRMSWDDPSFTLTARFDSFSRGKFGHPIMDRTITLREGARIQTFPDWFVFEGTKVEVARQIGNAVPPKLAEAIASQIKKIIEGALAT